MKKERTWEQIVDTLVSEFKKGAYKENEKMPGEQKMADRFKVSRTEVRKAYDRLKELGYIYSMQGYGSFFSGKKEKIRLFMNDSSSFTEKMNSLGVRYETVNMGMQKVKDPSLILSMMELPEQNTVYKLTRLRLIEGQPAAVHISYLASCSFSALEQDGPGITSLYDYMKAEGHDELKSENILLGISAPSKKERTLLEIKGYASCLVLSSKNIDVQTGQILEIARTVYRSDRFLFAL